MDFCLDFLLTDNVGQLALIGFALVFYSLCLRTLFFYACHADFMSISSLIFFYQLGNVNSAPNEASTISQRDIDLVCLEATFTNSIEIDDNIGTVNFTAQNFQVT